MMARPIQTLSDAALLFSSAVLVVGTIDSELWDVAGAARRERDLSIGRRKRERRSTAGRRDRP
jgi:hypothetical protein